MDIILTNNYLANMNWPHTHRYTKENLNDNCSHSLRKLYLALYMSVTDHLHNNFTQGHCIMTNQKDSASSSFNVEKNNVMEISIIKYKQFRYNFINTDY